MAEKLYIPTFIADSNFKPASVQPRVFFFNGKKEVDTPWRFTYQSGPSSFFVSSQNNFPYFDHYSTSSIGQDPNLDSDSLLFFNEGTVYGYTPVNNLYTKYWEKYVGLLYNPSTRFVECYAVIPFGVYANLKLNDVVIYKGNHFHLRAINDYNLKTGECKLQLLGPILDDTFDGLDLPAITPIQPEQPSTTTTSSTTSTSTTTEPTGSTTTTTTCVPAGNLDSIAIGYSVGSSTTACEKTDVRVVYKTGLWLDPSTVVYSSADGCNVLPGFYAPLGGEEGAGSVFQIDQYGDVVGSAQCPTEPTTTQPPTVYNNGYRTTDGSPISAFACGTTNTILYTNKSTFNQVGAGSGTRVYTDTNGTPLVGGNTWFGISETSGASTRTILVDNSGYVQNDGSCTTTTSSTTTTSTTSTTTAAPTWYSFTVSYDETNEQTACADNNTFTVYSTKPTMTKPGEGLSYLYNSQNVNDPVIGGYYSDKTNNYYYYTEGNNGLVQEVLPCPAATTTTTQSPCYLVGVVRNRNAELACCDGISDTVYFNATSVENATIYYGTDATCSSPFPFSQYFYVVGGQYYQWVGGVMSGPFNCPNCP